MITWVCMIVTGVMFVLLVAIYLRYLNALGALQEISRSDIFAPANVDQCGKYLDGWNDCFRAFNKMQKKIIKEKELDLSI